MLLAGPTGPKTLMFKRWHVTSFTSMLLLDLSLLISTAALLIVSNTHHYCNHHSTTTSNPVPVSPSRI